MRFACVSPALQCPAQVSFAGYVLPSSPSPLPALQKPCEACTWLSHALSTMLDKTPQNHRSPSLFSKVRLSYPTQRLLSIASPFTSSGFSVTLRRTQLPRIQVSTVFLSGVFGASRVLQHISSCMPRPEDSDGPSHPRLISDVLVLPSANVKTLGIRNLLHISKLYQHFRVRDHPYGLQDSLCTLHLLFNDYLVAGSATGATLDTGEWLTLTRRGLSPRKICRASPGAITSV